MAQPQSFGNTDRLKFIQEKNWKDLLDERKQTERAAPPSQNLQTQVSMPMRGMPLSQAPSMLGQNAAMSETPTQGASEAAFSDELRQERTARIRQKQQEETQVQTQASALIVPKTVKSLSAKILFWSWTSLIPTFGLTLIYINIHLVCAYIANFRAFCKFGEEWRFGPVAVRSRALEIVEVIAVILLDILFFALLNVIFIPMFAAAYCTANPLDCLGAGFSGIWQLIKGAVGL